ncbi:MAG: hypothetical protein IGS03_12505 [Candidatus Sericytochromatia bacterium]|nr:hypothetical protein [Candidatus Sericytochromatia bacterium]
MIHKRSQIKDTIPTWHQEALAQGIDYIVLIYEKAEGFAFCPSRLDTPFRVGGDYDGNFITTAEGALDYYERFFHKAFIGRIQWFIPYLHKVHAAEDFSLQDLKLKERKLRVIKGRWPW